MRQLLVGVAISAALVGGAAAQPSSYHQSGFTSETSPLGYLPPVPMEWMLREAVRQSMKPTSLEQLATDIDTAVGADIEAVGKKARVGRADMASAMRYEILKEALDLVKADIKERKKEGAKDDMSTLALQQAEARRKELEGLVKQARKTLTRKAQGIISG